MQISARVKVCVPVLVVFVVALLTVYRPDGKFTNSRASLTRDTITGSQATGVGQGNQSDVGKPTTIPSLQDASPTARSHGYVLVLKTPGQQSSGLKSFLSVQCWVGSFNLPLYVVEPFIENSKVHTLPNTNLDQLFSLEDFYDIAHYNTLSRKQGWAEVVSWGNFAQNAPKNVIYIRVKNPRHMECYDFDHEPLKSPTVVWSSQEQCFSSHDTNSVLSVINLNLCVVRVVQVWPRPCVCNEAQMYQMIFGEWKPEEVTLIFQSWAEIFYIPNTSLAEPSACWRACHDGLEDKYHPSHQLLSHAEAYETMHATSKGHFKIAVMLRSEKIFTSMQNRVDKWKEVLYSCLARTTDIVHRLQSKQEVAGHPFMTVDIGRYGSASWGHSDWHTGSSSLRLAKKLLPHVKSTLINLLNHSMTFDEWEESFSNVTGGIKDRGYIAALQMIIVSRADCIVIMGSGTFLKLAVSEYMDKHPDPSLWCIHLVCVNNKYKKQYEDMLQSRAGKAVNGTWEQEEFL